MQRSFEEVIRSGLNKSKSKQAHTFPHQPRFQTNKVTFFCKQSRCPQAFYDLNAVMISSQIKQKQKSFSQSARDFKANSSSPGPFAYSVKSFLEQNSNKKVGSNFSQSKRQIFSTREKIPGPGAYSPKIIKNKQPTFIIGQKLHHPLSNSPVGPGQYQTQKYNTLAGTNNFYSKYNKSQTFKIGTQQRFHSPSFTSPGPNQYPSKNQIQNKTFSFGKQKRHSIFQGFVRTPGPGAYHQFSEFAQRRRRLEGNLRKMQTIVKEK